VSLRQEVLLPQLHSQQIEPRELKKAIASGSLFTCRGCGKACAFVGSTLWSVRGVLFLWISEQVARALNFARAVLNAFAACSTAVGVFGKSPPGAVIYSRVPGALSIRPAATRSSLNGQCCTLWDPSVPRSARGER
jgi:hypothetical protein